MHFETRLWQFTKGVRLRMVYTVLIGLVATCFGIARLALLGWLIGRIFAGDGLQELFVPVLAVALVIVIRGALEHGRALVAHATAARVQLRLRRRLFDKMTELGPSYVGQQRSGDVTLSLVDGVEQLEVYFGQYLPQSATSGKAGGLKKVEPLKAVDAVNRSKRFGCEPPTGGPSYHKSI